MNVLYFTSLFFFSLYIFCTRGRLGVRSEMLGVSLVLWNGLRPRHALCSRLTSFFTPLFPWSFKLDYLSTTTPPTLTFHLVRPIFLSSFAVLWSRLAEWRVQYFLELTPVDYFAQSSSRTRFALTYRFASALWREIRLEIKCWVGGFTQALPTLSMFYPGIGWSEREVWDMVGVRFRTHPDLRRLLTDYGFRGFPLRKEFPVVGFQQVRYDEVSNSVLYEPLYLMQEERESLTINPWLVRNAPRTFVHVIFLGYAVRLTVNSVLC